jgi:hypothetical protein
MVMKSNGKLEIEYVPMVYGELAIVKEGLSPFTKHGNTLRIGGGMIDNSTGKPEIEFSNPKDAFDLMKMPKYIKEIEKKINSIEHRPSVIYVGRNKAPKFT